MIKNRFLAFVTALLLATIFTACVSSNTSLKSNAKVNTSFTLALVPDTQNYLDYTKQKASGFAIDSSELFMQQMQFLADNSVSNGGDIAFVASVGDVWQHQSKKIDADHQARGITSTPNPFLDRIVKVADETLTIEIPKAREGYQLISDADLPFGVSPGNHDHDAMWTSAKFPPNTSKPLRELKVVPEDLGILHIGGLDNFRSVFGAEQTFFKDKPWYIDSFRGGESSAQKFTAGGYTFLHIALEMQADDATLAWAGNNSAEQMWQKLFSQHDQIFLVLCGHQHGQSYRMDSNVNGKRVFQVLADYQDRGQIGIDAGQPKSRLTRKAEAIGDGWLRLMEFDLNAQSPKISVKTYSTYYKKYSTQEENYAAWYKEQEHPKLSDKDFLAMDDFVLDLGDFHQRFASTR